MIRFLFLAFLSGLVSGRPEGAFPVHRQDFTWNARSTPMPYQEFATRHDGVHRVERQDFGATHLPRSYYETDFGALPGINYGPRTSSYDFYRYQPGSIFTSPPPRSAYMPKLFIPSPNQIYGKTVPIWPTSTSSIFGSSTESTTIDDNVLPPIPMSSVDEGEPLSALSDHSKKTSTSRPIKYKSFNDDVEINDEQKDLLNSYQSVEETERQFQPAHRVRRDLYSSYPPKFETKISLRPLRPQIYLDLYEWFYDPVTSFDQRFGVPGKSDDYFFYVPFFDDEDFPTALENFVPYRPVVVENNEIKDDVVAEPVLTTETYTGHQSYHPYDLSRASENLIPHYPNDVEMDENSDGNVVSVVSTSETPTTNVDGDEYAEVREGETSGIFLAIDDRNQIACECPVDAEAEVVISAMLETTTKELVFEDPSDDIMDAIFDALKTVEPVMTDEIDDDNEQERKTIRPLLPTNVDEEDEEQEKPLPPNVSEVAATESDEDNQALRDLDNALKKLLDSVSLAPETQTELLNEDVDFRFRPTGMDNNKFIFTTNETPRESSEDREYDDDDNSHADLKFQSNQIPSMPKTTSEMPGPAQFVMGDTIAPSSTISIWEKENENGQQSEEENLRTLMLNIIRLEPKVSFASDENELE